MKALQVTAAPGPDRIRWACLGPAAKRRYHLPHQSPSPGFGEKYWSLSGFPSQSLESGGGAFLAVMFGQIFAYWAFNNAISQAPDRCPA